MKTETAKTDNQVQLRARASFVAEWITAGRIDRPEGFRLEMDAYLGRDSGPIQWLDNNEETECEGICGV